MAIQCVSGSMEFSTRNSIFYLTLNLRIGIAAVRPISVVAPRVSLINVRCTELRNSMRILVDGIPAVECHTCFIAAPELSIVLFSLRGKDGIATERWSHRRSSMHLP